MPELPEVQTIVSELQPRLQGREIISVDIYWPGSIARLGPEEFAFELGGQRIERVWRRAKNIVMDLAGDYELIVHLRMTGKLLLRDERAPEERFTRVVMHLDGHQELRFTDIRKFGRLTLLAPEQFQCFSAQLGIEPLSKEFTTAALKNVLDRRAQRIKTVLLDQRYIAGLGNIYADEALFEAGIHPERPAKSLIDEEIGDLHHAIRLVLKAGIKDKGTSFDSYVDAFGKPGVHQRHLKVYHRTGKPCLVCGTPIERIIVGGRATHFCPKCQQFRRISALETAPLSQKARRPQG